MEITKLSLKEFRFNKENILNLEEHGLKNFNFGNLRNYDVSLLKKPIMRTSLLKEEFELVFKVMFLFNYFENLTKFWKFAYLF